MTRKIFAVLFFLSLVAQVVVANSLVSKGKQMDELVLERKRLESQLLDLENKIAQASSLSAIKEKAKDIGMRPGNLQYLPPAPVALNR